jgi:hypothetical protein
MTLGILEKKTQKFTLCTSLTNLPTNVVLSVRESVNDVEREIVAVSLEGWTENRQFVVRIC